MEIIDELYDALRAGDAEKFTQIHLSQSGHDLFFEVQVDYEEPIQRKAYLTAIKKVLPKNFLKDFKLKDNPFNLSNVGMLYPEEMADLFMAIFICALDENDQETIDNLHAIEPKTSEHIGGFLDGYGHSMMSAGEFAKGVQIYDLALKFTSPGKSVYANALWFAQKDNTGLPINKERNDKWLEICLPHAPENPGIFFNAACVFMEHQEPEKVIDNIRNAIHFGAGIEGLNGFHNTREMAKDPLFDPIRDRVDAIFNTPPIGVNAKAWWSESDCEWIYGERDQSGRFQGMVEYWRPGGTLVCQTEHIDGEPNGTFTRFHESGEVSRQGRMKGSQIIGMDTGYRSYVFTSENAIPEQAPLIVHSIETHWVDGNFSHQVLRDINNALLTPAGEPVPDQPANVPEGAFFLNDIWSFGSYSKDAQKIGTWQYFMADGEFLKEEFYTDEEEYVYSILRSDRTDAAFEKGLLVSGNWIGIVTLLDENKNELGTFDSTGADLIRDPNLRQWVHDVRAVDWENLESAYSDTIAVEQHLIQFALAEDPESRDDFLGNLYSYICHQGSTYESSAKAIPLLIRLSAVSESEEVQLRSLVLVEHMSLIPRGKYDHWTAEGHVFSCTVAVSAAAYDLMALYSRAENPDHRIAVLNCLAGAFENIDVVTFLSEETPDVENYAVRIAALGNFKAITPEIFAAVDSMPNLLKLAVVYGAALWWDGPDLSNGLEVLLGLLDEEEINESFYKFPCVDGPVIEELAFMIQPDEASIGQLTERLSNRLTEVKGLGAVQAVEASLRIVFAQEEFRIYQGKILRTIAAKDDLWTSADGEPLTLVNFTEILDSWDFPNTREAFGTFSETWPTD